MRSIERMCLISRNVHSAYGRMSFWGRDRVTPSGHHESSETGYTYTCSAQLSSAPMPASKSQKSQTGNSLSLWRISLHAFTFGQMTRDIISILQYLQNTHASRVILF